MKQQLHRTERVSKYYHCTFRRVISIGLSHVRPLLYHAILITCIHSNTIAFNHNKYKGMLRLFSMKSPLRKA